MRRARLHAIAAAGAVFAATLVPAVTGHASSSAAGLRIFTATGHVTLLRYPEDPDLFVPPDIYLTPTGGSFEVDAVTQPDGRIALWQVRRDDAGHPHRVRAITPAGTVTMSDGLPRFITASLAGSGGRTVASATTPWCPGGWFGQSRVDGSGPDRPTFPYFCGTSLTRAMVWGVDAGWATPLFLNLVATDVPDGDYTLTVGISPGYADQLGLSPADASVSLDATVRTQQNQKPCPPEIVCRAVAASAVAAAPAQVTQRAVRSFGAGPKSTGGDGGLPNLASLPAHDLSVHHDRRNGRDYLGFGATIWNAGPGPLELEGFRSDMSQPMQARQFIYRDGRPVRSEIVGTFEFDTRRGHHHWHMEDVAQYDLLSANGDRLVRSEKQSFCLAPTDPVDLTAPGALLQPDSIGLYSSCPADDSIWLRESLPAGWGDTYFQGVAGQAFNITGLANGRYLVRVTTDPFHRLLETTYDDNASLLSIRLTGTPGHRHVRILGPVSG